MLIDYIYEKSVTGLILDEKNQPMPGVNISIKGTSKGIFRCRR
jgi:hypothetical protein